MDRPSLEGAMDVATNTDAERAGLKDPGWRDRWLTIARRAWPVVAGLALVANLLALPDFARAQLNHTIRAELPGWHLSPAGYVTIEVAYSAIPMLIFLAVGILIFLRAARDPVALLCSYMMMTFAFGLAGFLPGVTITNPVLNAASLILTGTAQVLGGWFFLVFPSGSFVPRWSRWCVLAVAAVVLVVTVPSIARVQPTPGAAQPVSFGLLVFAAGAQVYRYRRASTASQRQQTKWVVFGLAAAIAVIVVTRLIGLLLSVVAPSVYASQVAGNLVGGGTFILGVVFIPVCIGIAVLRTHLWDIGLVISRTVTYAVVTVLLVGVYAGLVLLATRVLPFHTAVAVAVSTLAAAAIFNPLRHRVQRVVDRRFNRARYDADRAVAAFAARLQDAADPDTVHAHLLAAVHQALEPAHASVWIKPR
jgi:hypothetical protein